MAGNDVAERPSLPVELHAATRSEHALLNRTIIARLPLCLPLATSNPSLYTQGMTVFSHIYYGFEDAWENLLQGNTLSQRQRDILTDLNVPRLHRKERLETSLRNLRSRSDAALQAQLSRLDAETLHFEEEIMRSIQEKPHLLLAYTWTMYLALFNGGRWIAKQLLNAGTLFWHDQERLDTVQSALSFWFFGDDEDYDGDDIKVAFKEKFNYVDAQLTDVERDEIIAESKKLFGICADMIAYLDRNTQNTKTASNVHVQEISISQSPPDKSTVFGYLSSLAHVPVTGIWRSLFRNSQTSGPVPLRQNIEQTDG